MRGFESLLLLMKSYTFLNLIIDIISILISILVLIIAVLISVAYFTLAERKILGAIQRRRGPNVVGAYGLLQPLSDGFKLLVKEIIIPADANKAIFILGPLITFVISLIGWAVIPFDSNDLLSDCNIGLLYMFGGSSLGVYGIIVSGWASNSKYAFLGALRSTAQMVSYELTIGFIITCVALLCGSFNLGDIVSYQESIWFSVAFFPLAVILFIAGLAETNRHPFDLPEAEAELVSGYNVEYSAFTFALFSLGEYSNMLTFSALITILFFGGWNAPFAFLHFIPGFIWFSLKILFFVIMYVIMRAALPRYRYDQLMNIGWKIFLPVTLGYFLFVMFYVTYCNILNI